MDTRSVEKIAALARLAPDPQEVEALAPQLTRILEWVEQLSAVDTEGVEPLASPAGIAATPERTDIVTDGGCAEDILANAPESAAGFFVVQKVVEQEE